MRLSTSRRTSSGFCSQVERFVRPAEKERTWRVDPKDIALGRELGRGSFGVVREGRWHGTAVAVKLLPFEASASDAVGLFTREVATMINFHVRSFRPCNVRLTRPASTRTSSCCSASRSGCWGSRCSR